jgi:AAA domain
MSTFRAFDFEPDDDTEAGPRFHLTRFGDVSIDTSIAYLIKGLIPSGGLTLIWGPPKCGKSFCTFDAMMHVALGISYRGRRVQQGGVVYIALEGGKGFQRRIEAYERYYGITDAPFYLITDRTDLVHDHETLIADIKEQTPNAPVAVVIDTLNRSLAGSESSDEDMAVYIKAADAVREAFGCAVIIVHHCGVDGTRPRGHTSLTGATDAQIAVSRDEKGNIISTVEYLKDGAEGDVIASRLQLVELGTDDDGELITSCVILPIEGEPYRPAATTKSRKKETKPLRVFRQAFIEALDAAGQTIRVRNNGPAVRAVDLKYVKTQFNLRYPTGDTEPGKRSETQGRAFRRAITTLPEKEFATWVDGEAEWIWLIK